MYARVGSSPISRIYKSEFDSERKQIRIFVIPVKSYSESTDPLQDSRRHSGQVREGAGNTAAVSWEMPLFLNDSM